MDKNKVNQATPKGNQKKGFDVVAQGKRVQAMKDKLLAQIEEIDLNTTDYARKKENINKIYKLSGGMFATNISKDRDVEFTVTSTSKIKELVESSQKIAKIMDYFIDNIGFVTKKGNTDKAMELIKEQAALQDIIDQTTKTLDAISEQYLRKGIGSRSDLEDLAKKDRALKQEEIKALYKTGMACSEIVTKLSVDIEQVRALTAPFKAEHLDARKEEIVKAVINKEELAELANRLEIKNKVLKTTLDIWAVDNDKLAKALLVDSAVVDAPENTPEKSSKAKPGKGEETKEVV